MPYPDNFRSYADGSPYAFWSPDAMKEAEALACYAAAEQHLREIEAVATALSIFWDHYEDRFSADDATDAAAVSEWLATMPDHLKSRVIQHIADDRRKLTPLNALVVMGRRFAGEAA